MESSLATTLQFHIRILRQAIQRDRAELERLECRCKRRKLQRRLRINRARLQTLELVIEDGEGNDVGGG